MNKARTPIASFGWVMIILLLVLGAINFADKAVLGLAAVPIIKELHLSPAQYGLVSGSLFWLFAISSVLVTGWSISRVVTAQSRSGRDDACSGSRRRALAESVRQSRTQ
jgi:MFS family permease